MLNARVEECLKEERKKHEVKKRFLLSSIKASYRHFSKQILIGQQDNIPHLYREISGSWNKYVNRKSFENVFRRSIDWLIRGIFVLWTKQVLQKKKKARNGECSTKKSRESKIYKLISFRDPHANNLKPIQNNFQIEESASRKRETSACIES